jgi:hypothetical protein
MAAPTSRRRPLGIALVALATVLAYIAILAIWADRQILDTNHWTRASSEMLERPVVRAQVADYLVDQLYANVDVQSEIRQALPERAQPLAGPAAGALRNLVERGANEILSRPRAQQAWEDANRNAHALLLKVLEGGGPVLSTTNGVVVLDLKQLLAELEARTGIGGRVADRLPADSAQIEILRSDQLELAQDAFTALGALPIIAVVLSLALFGLALAVAPGWRRQATRGYGIGLVAAGVAALASASYGGDAIVNSLVTTQAGLPAAREIWGISTTLLEQAAGAAIGYGLALILGVWLAGPTRPAATVRRVAAPYLREPAIAWTAFAAVVAVVVLWWAPTPATRNPVTAALLVLLFGLGFEALRRLTAREHPSADRHELEQHARDHVVAAFHALRERTAVAGAGVTRHVAAPRGGGGGNGTSAPSATDPRLDQIEQLGRLRDAGVLDDVEFSAEKARILGHGAERVKT